MYMRVWLSIPPKRPKKLQLYIAKITRNIALDMYKKHHAMKRGGEDNICVLLGELDECIPSRKSVENEIDEKELTLHLNLFLKAQSLNSRAIFLDRYWYAMSVKDLSEKYSLSESNIKSNLYRTRKKLKKYLESRGVEI